MLDDERAEMIYNTITKVLFGIAILLVVAIVICISLI